MYQSEISNLTNKLQIAVVKVSFTQLGLLTKVKPLLSCSDLGKAVHVFICSQCLQLVQNVAALLLTQFTPILYTPLALALLLH